MKEAVFFAHSEHFEYSFMVKILNMPDDYNVEAEKFINVVTKKYAEIANSDKQCILCTYMTIADKIPWDPAKVSIGYFDGYCPNMKFDKTYDFNDVISFYNQYNRD